MRALIENDGSIDDGFCGQYSMWKEKYLGNVPMDVFFDIIITDAYEHQSEVVDAITKCDEIWVDSAYVGDSARLLDGMLVLALQLGWKDKTLINMNKWMDVSWHMPDIAKSIIPELEEAGNKFIYADDNEYKLYLP